MLSTRTMTTLTLVGAAGACWGTPVAGLYTDLTPGCDAHGTLPAIEELGDAPAFPGACLIQSSWVFTQQSACPLTDDPLQVNVEIRMVNFSGRSFTDLFYVADSDTTISNVDGIAISNAAPGAFGQSFKIDSAGLNTPLVLESGTFDGIFSPLETWVFIIDDFNNAAGLPPAPFGSVDFAAASPSGSSTGSIIHFAIPAPGTATLLASGALVALRRRR